MTDEQVVNLSQKRAERLQDKIIRQLRLAYGPGVMERVRRFKERRDADKV
jgi:hypothetical protein